MKCTLLPFLLLSTFYNTVQASYWGAVECHTGEDIPGPTHSGGSGGLLSNKGIEVYLVLEDATTTLLSETEVTELVVGIPYTLKAVIPQGSYSLGHYFRASSADVDASAALRGIAGDDTVKGGVSWVVDEERSVTCDAGVSAVTHTDLNPVNEVQARLNMPYATEDFSLEMTVLTDYPMFPGYYYTNFQLKFVSPVNPVPAPSAAPTGEASTSPTAAPTTTEMAQSACTSDVPGYEYMTKLSDEVTFYWNPTNDKSEYLVARLHTTKKAYVAWGVAPDTRGLMIGSEAIVGLPDEPSESNSNNPGKYYMDSYFVEGTYLMQDSKQTLLNNNSNNNSYNDNSFTVQSSVTQDENGTTLSFIKKLNEPGEIPILPVGQNTFMYAIGGSNLLNWHPDYGVFYLDLSVSGCTAFALDEEHSYELYWQAHGILMSVAWLGATPMAMITAKLRKWRLTSMLNLISMACTVVGIILAFSATQKQGHSHFELSSDNPHALLGLITLLILIIQLACEVVIGKQKQTELMLTQHRSTAIFADQTSGSSNLKGDSLDEIDIGVINKYGLWVVRLSLFVMTFVAIYTGLSTYTDEYNADDNIIIAFLVFACLWVVLYVGVYFTCGKRIEKEGKEKNSLMVKRGSSLMFPSFQGERFEAQLVNRDLNTKVALDSSVYTGVLSPSASNSRGSSRTNDSSRDDKSSKPSNRVVHEEIETRKYRPKS
jgi:hypothetical protein